MSVALEWETPLTAVLGKSAEKLRKPPRDIQTLGDFLTFFPRRYIDARKAGSFAQFRPGDYAVLVARVKHVTKRTMRSRRGTMAVATIEDEDGREASVTFFRAQPHYSVLQPGTSALFSGELSWFNGNLQLTHPQYSVLDDASTSVYDSGIVPVYTQVKGLTNLQLTQAFHMAFTGLDLPEPLPDALRGAEGLVGLTQAYRGLHLPTSWDDITAGRERLRFDEAFLTQLVLASRRAQARSQPARARAAKSGGLLERFDASLPFDLTPGQRQVGEAIASDMAESVPMNRLLQGEVGSGKTVVALRAMLTCVDAGGQAALLAPTEVLAAQHATSIRAMLGPLGVGGTLLGDADGTTVTLLTGSMPTAARKQALLDIASGTAGIVVGTHALLQEKVQFADLGLVVVDEQHRFGVEQRANLTAKADHPPHVLVMTATPIPRTVAMTAFGDLDISTLKSLPKGRAPIVSHVVPAHNPVWMNRVWQRIAEEVAQGRQVYVVAGRIDPAAPDEESVNAAGEPVPQPVNVTDLLDVLRAEPQLQHLRIDLMHGRLRPDEKDAVMSRFAAGEVDVLVATTVIEVGVDVPNASMIVIMDADRFGLSQLHQLRGRVGRGSTGGLCLFVTQSQDAAVHERLARVAESHDGFAISELDLELRSEGDVLGAAQSGRRSSLTWLRLTRPQDQQVIERARVHAAELVAHDPDLTAHETLAEAVHRRVNDEQAEFLEMS